MMGLWGLSLRRLKAQPPVKRWPPAFEGLKVPLRCQLYSQSMVALMCAGTLGVHVSAFPTPSFFGQLAFLQGHLILMAGLSGSLQNFEFFGNLKPHSYWLASYWKALVPITLVCLGLSSIWLVGLDTRESLNYVFVGTLALGLLDLVDSKLGLVPQWWLKWRGPLLVNQLLHVSLLFLSEAQLEKSPHDLRI